MSDEQDIDWWHEWTMRSRVLLSGFTGKDEAGLPTHEYLKAGDAFEDECRLSLATLLRSGNPPKDILRLLAELIAPDDFEQVPEPKFERAAERKIVFKFRRKGRRRNHQRDSAIAIRVAQALWHEDTVEAAIGSVSKDQGSKKNTGLSEESVRKIWKRLKPLL